MTYFPTTLTLADVERLTSEGDDVPTFRYSSLGGYEGAFCGYAGYLHAQVPGLSPEFRRNLRDAYRFAREHYEARMLQEVKTNGKVDLVEVNGISVLLYPREFEFPKFCFGLRYNENWTEECMKFGHTRHVRLCELVDDKEAIMLSWRDSKFVPPLKAKLPTIELKPVPATETPVTIQDNIKAIVLPFDLKDYMAPRNISQRPGGR